MGVEADYRLIPNLGSGECERLQEMLDADINAVIITPGEPHCLHPLIDEAEAKNIRVVCVASDAPGSQRSTVVRVDPDIGDRLVAELMGRFVPPQAQTAVVTGTLNTEDHCRKTEGFRAAFPQYCQGGQILDVIEGHEDGDETFEKCLKFLKAHPDVAGLHVNIVTCLPVCYALNACGLAGNMRLITTDLFGEMLPFFEKQIIHASIYQRPYVQGQTAVRLIVENALHARPIPHEYLLGPAIVMKSNLYLFRETRNLKRPLAD